MRSSEFKKVESSVAIVPALLKVHLRHAFHGRMRLVLGSSSKWRRRLFEENFPQEQRSFTSADIDEYAIRHPHAETLTRLIANAKADAILERMLEEDPSAAGLLICMDQVVRCEGVIREKPSSAEQARKFLQSYSLGAQAECINGIVVHDLQTGYRCEANETATVSFSPIPEHVIDEAIAKGSIFASAGAFQIEDPLFSPFVAQIEGSPEAVQGLPIARLRDLIAQASSSHPLSHANIQSADSHLPEHM